jgi:hypothetical protein
MDCDVDRRVKSPRRDFRARPVLAAASVVLVLASRASAQGHELPKVTPEQIQQVRQIEKDSELIGSWDQQYTVVEQATDNVFQQQDWSSEPDQYARSLMREVGRIPPWKPRDRQEAFMNSLQGRYSLTPEQRTTLDTEVQREAIMVTAKHFKDILPVAMEVVRTRANGEPFTAEQVQRWSKAFKPLMADSLASMQKVTDNLKKTMTSEQRQRLEADVGALVKRHRDVEKMVTRWEAGQWNPADWGLQNDPLHAAAAAEYEAKGTEKDALVRAAEAKRPLDEGINVTDESAWDIYVKNFCNRYQCTDVQRTTAQAVLKSSKQEATAIRNARREQIEKCQHLIAAADSPAKRKAHEDEMRRLQAPLEYIFNRMKSRLHEQVLTTEQRMRVAPASPPPSKPGAAPQGRPQPPARPPTTLPSFTPQQPPPSSSPGPSTTQEAT